MHTRKLFIVTAAALTVGGYLPAQAQEARTRADVHAEAVAAAREAAVGQSSEAMPARLLAMPSYRGDAEVRAEAVGADQGPDGSQVWGDRPLPAQSTASTLPRAQVHAEAIESIRLGLTGTEEGEPRLPTRAEQESIRQAGLRAIGMADVARS